MVTCVKNQTIEAKKKKMQYMNLDRVEHLNANISRKKNTRANCLPLGAIFLAHVIKVYATLTAHSSINCHEHAPIHDHLAFSTAMSTFKGQG